METITLAEVLDWLDTGSPCELTVITCDHKQKKGGEELVLKMARKHILRPADQAAISAAQPKIESKRNPGHFENSTRNMILPNGEIRKVHIRLIRQFNGKTVL